MLLLVAAACAPQVLDLYETCDLGLSLEETQGAPGDTITVYGGPLTADFDTRVEVGGVPAQVVSLERGAFCEACEACRVEAECLVCGPCLGEELEEERRVECFGDPFADADITRLGASTGDTGTPAVGGVCGSCEEQFAFIVPALPAGPTQVLVVNANGTSEPIPFMVTGVTSTGGTGGTADTGGTSTTGRTGETGIASTGDTGITTRPDTGFTGDTNDTGDTYDTGDTFHTGDTFGTGDTGATADTAATGDTGL